MTQAGHGYSGVVRLFGEPVTPGSIDRPDFDDPVLVDK